MSTPVEPAQDDRPHVVLLVGNPVQHDARVRKTALSAASFGLRVTVVAVTPEPEGSEEMLGPVTVVNVAVQPVMSNRSAELRRLRRRLVLPVGYGTRGAAAAGARRLRLAVLDLQADTGRGVARGDYAGRSVRGISARARRKLRGRVHGVRRRVVAGRTRVGRWYLGRRLPLDPARAAKLYAHRPMGNWRRLMPAYLDLNVAFAPVLDRLRPDLVHANDVDMIGIAADAVDRARAKGRIVRWLYDAHEYVPGQSRYRPDRIAGMADHELEYIRRADAVLTVSEPIADAIQRRAGLSRRPTVVLNTATSDRHPDRPRPSVRAAAGLSEGVPLLVYSGNIDPDRGLTALVRSLAYLDPEVHIAIVTNAKPGNWYVAELLQAAEEAAAVDRLHVVPYVAGDQLVDYLSTATAGVHGLTHVPNHEMALPNKLFDYMHARLPMVVSDVRAMAELVTELGIGEVYAADDPQALAAAATKVLADPERYARNLDDPQLIRRFSWESQEDTLRSVYGALLGRDLTQGAAWRA